MKNSIIYKMAVMTFEGLYFHACDEEHYHDCDEIRNIKTWAWDQVELVKAAGGRLPQDQLIEMVEQAEKYHATLSEY